MQIVIFSTKIASVIVDRTEVPYINATITLTPNRESDKIEVGLFTYLGNKPVMANVTANIEQVDVDSNTDLDQIDATCCDLMCMKIASLGYEIELKGSKALPSKKDVDSGTVAV